MSLRDRILSATTAFKPVAVEVPEMGGTVYVRPLTLAASARFQALMSKEPARGPVTLLIECLCDEAGNRLFKSEDEALLGEIPPSVAGVLGDVIIKASKLDGGQARGVAGE